MKNGAFIYKIVCAYHISYSVVDTECDLFLLYISIFINRKKEYADSTWGFLTGFAKWYSILMYPCEVMLGDLKRRIHLSCFFRRWQFYIRIVLVPSIIGAFGVQGSLEGKVLRCCMTAKLKVPLHNTYSTDPVVDNRRWFVQLQESKRSCSKFIWFYGFWSFRCYWNVEQRVWELFGSPLGVTGRAQWLSGYLIEIEMKWNEMKSRGWEDNRRALLQYILTCDQQSQTSAYKGNRDFNASISLSYYS